MWFLVSFQVLSASSSLCGRVLYHHVHNYASHQTAGGHQSVQTIVKKTPLLSGFLVAYWPIPNRYLGLTVVRSLLIGGRLYAFSGHLVYSLWYSLVNSPICVWNRLNPTFTMAGHLFRNPTSTIGTTTPPNIVKSSISVSVSKMPARDKIRSTSFSGAENLQLRKWLEMSFLQLCKGTTWGVQLRSSR